MARFNEQQSEQIRKERTEQILVAALSVFSQHGVERTKMSMIAEAAGVSHGLMYHYFKSKEEVLKFSLEWAMSGAEELVREVMYSALPPIDKVAYFTKIALSESNQDVFRIIQQFIRYPLLDETTKKLIEDTGRMYIDYLLPIFEAGQQQGQIIDDDPVKLVNLYLNVLSGILADEIEWFQQDLEWSVAVLLRMIKAP